MGGDAGFSTGITIAIWVPQHLCLEAMVLVAPRQVPGVEISVRLSDQQGSQEEATGPCGCCLGSLGGEDARESPFSQPSPGQPHPKVLHTGLVLLLREKTECCEH